MDRRTFLTWMGLGLLANISPLVISACITQARGQLASDSSSKSLESVLFYVAPGGNDGWSGKREKPNTDNTDGPFATLQRARNAVRELKHLQGGTLQQPVTILVRGGIYFLPESLVFTPEDSGTQDFPITYKAYPQEKPVISGGRLINDWRQQGNLWVANLPDVQTGQWYFRLLRVGDDWAIRARYPNFDPNNPLTGGWLYNIGSIGSITDEQSEIGFSDYFHYLPIAPAQFPDWQNWEEAEVNVFMKYNYGNSILPVTSVDQENYRLLGNFTNQDYPVALGNRFFIENTREALDSPGEWYLDPKTGELLYWSTVPEFPNNIEIIAPRMDRLFVLQGNMENENFVEHLHFQGLTFTDTDYTLAKNYFIPADAAIWLSTARHCRIKYCNFMRLGGYAVRIEQRSHKNYIVGNSMEQLGQGGVVLLDSKTTPQPFNNLIAYNDIHDCGKVYKHVAGVFARSSSGNRIAHNRIYRLPRYGISLKSEGSYSHNNIVEYNEIVDTNLETSDTGAIETTGRDKQLSGNVIRFNFIRNVIGMGTTDSGQIVSPTFTWGIYLDAYSSGTEVYGNIVVDTVRGAVMIHGGKDNLVENNIFIDGEKNQIELKPLKHDPQFMKNNTIRRNILVYNDPKANILSRRKDWRRDLFREFNFNLYWHTGGLDIAKTENQITAKGNFAQWQAAGFDSNSLIADPLFVAPEKDDFRLKPNSPAFKLGFKSIPVERIGIKNFTLAD